MALSLHADSGALGLERVQHGAQGDGLYFRVLLRAVGSRAVVDPVDIAAALVSDVDGAVGDVRHDAPGSTTRIRAIEATQFDLWHGFEAE